MEDLISVIVPVYNVEKYLDKCVESIVNQSYKNLEIILIEDGSPDKCGKICDDYAKKDNRIKVIHKENGGLSDARNAGLEIARGEYIAFVDSDDYIAIDFISFLYNLSQKYGSDIVQCKYIKFYEEDLEQTPLEEHEEYVLTNREMMNELYGENCINAVVVWNKLYKRNLFDTLKFPKGKLNEDEFTTYKLYWESNNKNVITNKELYYYRHNEQGIMQSKFNLKRLDVIQALEERLLFLEEKDERELYKLTLNRYMDKLIGCYFLTKREIEKSSNVQKELLEKFGKKYKEAMKLNHSKKKKIKYVVFRYFPSLLTRFSNK